MLFPRLTGCAKPILYETKRTRYAQLDFSSGFHATPDAELRADSFSSLSHSLDAPMSYLPPMQLLRIHSAPVITHNNSQPSRSILERNVDVLRAGVAIRVNDGFAADAINILSQRCLQVRLPALHRHSKSDGRGKAQFTRNRGESVAQRREVLLRAQSLHRKASLFEHATHQLD